MRVYQTKLFLIHIEKRGGRGVGGGVDNRNKDSKI